MLGGLGRVTPGSNLGNFAMADTTSRSSLLLLLLFNDDCLGLFSTEDEDEEDASLSLLKKALQTEYSRFYMLFCLQFSGYVSKKIR